MLGEPISSQPLAAAGKRALPTEWPGPRPGGVLPEQLTREAHSTLATKP